MSRLKYIKEYCEWYDFDTHNINIKTKQPTDFHFDTYGIAILMSVNIHKAI